MKYQSLARLFYRHDKTHMPHEERELLRFWRANQPARKQQGSSLPGLIGALFLWLISAILSGIVGGVRGRR